MTDAGRACWVRGYNAGRDELKAAVAAELYGPGLSARVDARIRSALADGDCVDEREVPQAPSGADEAYDRLHGLDGHAQVPARALREAAQFFEHEMSRAWGGDTQWLTTGTRIAALVADILRERAADLDAERVAGVRRDLAADPDSEGVGTDGDESVTPGRIPPIYHEHTSAGCRECDCTAAPWSSTRHAAPCTCEPRGDGE